MPGSKDYVSVGKKLHVLVLLVNLKELYSSFLKGHADIEIGFSKFCQLEPKWCVFLGASGTHSVYTCTYHQNLKLILDPLNHEYEDLLKFLVCNPGKKYCMIHWCPNCPDDEEQLYLYLTKTIEILNISDGEIKLCQWTTTYGANSINGKC